MARAILRSAVITLSLCQGLLFAQEAEWIRPYQDFGGYWERLRRKDLGNVRAPWIDAFAIVFPTIGVGERVATVAHMTLVFDANGSFAHTQVDAVTEVRFVGADATGVSLEIRETAAGAGGDVDHTAMPLLMPPQCRTSPPAVHALYAYRPDWRYQAWFACRALERWSPWQLLRFPLTGSYVVNSKYLDQPDAKGLPLSFTMTGERLSVTVKQ